MEGSGVLFSGIVERTANVEGWGAANPHGARRLALSKVPVTVLGGGLLEPWSELVHGESIAVNGVCLTLAGVDEACVFFDLVRETCLRTTLPDLIVGDRVNLERSLRLSDRLGGHFVLGHVDAVGIVSRLDRQQEQVLLEVVVDFHDDFRVVPRGSVTVDGVSLTVADVSARGFVVALVPETMKNTCFGDRSVGDRVNLEMDCLGKWVRYLLQPNVS